MQLGALSARAARPASVFAALSVCAASCVCARAYAASAALRLATALAKSVARESDGTGENPGLNGTENKPVRAVARPDDQATRSSSQMLFTVFCHDAKFPRPHCPEHMGRKC